ncbi:hypothetical protein ASC77_25665 [Nocardioides sp. Root1257]|uniref:hypothetical protein n=1 Tax=unclassified Nocardioides TaxID=2615069 RepID=UPI0006F9842F|nr:MULTISPECIES: hypothetical protein [unclassified Nocardioides]KQW49900.1 hypothetical protein ASC77_25665 [Nocardioides sp. Root1257]KRC43379.1 hypothetical protein ASE24_20680 [Nocardioides sp. Root224]
MTTTQVQTVPAPTIHTGRRGLLLAIALTIAAVLTVAVVVPWNLGSEPAAPPGPTPAAPPPAYQPGGSVYDQQVPKGGAGPRALQHWALVYGPDGSIYKSQVPLGR